ncbi:divalent cation tolerance protein [Thalassospira xiamenensis M-5 = DSM 17429]|uniref:Divalent-cation tolerance protein CutA n=1 Tax=Thalassospira xiamenensis M-5 = DSM 17429 TaxID=1123366 RepID=A0AB72UD51_9PROT|nr:divalent-cation tolerance protein CutA [Thalassospira xiamenensis]AJD52103.1 divalent-cation tolerance protein CutA [Thalassospira xiamenensis M-5 = DSM 17429]SIS91453.1 divalent cation tolerance protein [Thalassospira xiamenensis M-5 = DSM 17429]
MTSKSFDRSDMVFLYVTSPDMEVARLIAGGAVRERLAACANIMPQMTAIYEWDGDIEEENEIVIILKSTSAAATALSEWITDHHPYDVPCILEIPLGRGNGPYVDWLRGQVAGATIPN